MTRPGFIKGVEPAALHGPFEVFPSSTEGIVVYHPEAGLAVHLSVMVPGPSIVYALTACCAASNERTGLSKRYCSACEAQQPEAKSDAEYVGEWDHGVEQWLMPALEPLTAAVVASELQELLEGLVIARVSMMEHQLAQGATWEEMENAGEILPIPHPHGTKVVFDPDRPAYRLLLK